MQIATQQLLPIDGFTYETAHGCFRARVVEAPAQISNPDAVHKIAVEFVAETDDLRVTRRLVLHLSQRDMERERGGVYRQISEWIYSSPASEQYFAFECRYGECAAMV